MEARKAAASDGNPDFYMRYSYTISMTSGSSDRICTPETLDLYPIFGYAARLLCLKQQGAPKQQWQEARRAELRKKLQLDCQVELSLSQMSRLHAFDGQLVIFTKVNSWLGVSELLGKMTSDGEELLRATSTPIDNFKQPA